MCSHWLKILDFVVVWVFFLITVSRELHLQPKRLYLFEIRQNLFLLCHFLIAFDFAFGQYPFNLLYPLDQQFDLH